MFGGYLKKSKRVRHVISPNSSLNLFKNVSERSLRYLWPIATKKDLISMYHIYLFFWFIYLHLPHKIYITERKWKKIYIYIYIITKIAQFAGQEKLQKKEKFKIKCNIKWLNFCNR